jgi:CRISPR-associated protein Cas10/Csm1 subtype III-A
VKFGEEFIEELIKEGEKQVKEKKGGKEKLKRKVEGGCIPVELKGEKLKIDREKVESLKRQKDKFWAFSKESRFPNWYNFQLTALYPAEIPEYQEEMDPCRTTTLFYQRQLEEIGMLAEEVRRGGKKDKELLMIVGDFWGIQDFIFRRLTIKGAPKMLRSRSAYVELLSYFLAWRLAEEFNGFVIRAAAGQFTIFAPNNREDWAQVLEEFRQDVNDYFREQFFGLNGLMLKGFEVSFEEVKDGAVLEEVPEELEKHRRKRGELTEKIRQELEREKLQKHYQFLFGDENPVMNIFKDAETDDTICQLCKARAGTKIEKKDLAHYPWLKEEDLGTYICETCLNQINLGTFLTKEENRYLLFRYSPIEGELAEGEKKVLILKLRKRGEKWYAQFLPNYHQAEELYFQEQKNGNSCLIINIYEGKGEWPFFPIKSYIPKDRNKHPLSFEEIASLENREEQRDSQKKEDKEKISPNPVVYGKNGEENTEKGGESKGERKGRLMALKADVDKLGSTFRKLTKLSFSKTNRLSRELDYFFSVYFPEKVIKEKYPNHIYVVFSGGDDLFLIGRYDKVFELAKELGEQFRSFTAGKATISIGLALFSPNTPVPAIARMAEEAEQQAKKCKGCIDFREARKEPDNSQPSNGLERPKLRRPKGVGEVEELENLEVGELFSDQERDGISIFGITMKFPDFLEIEERWQKICESIEEDGKREIPSRFLYRLVDIAKMAEEAEIKGSYHRWVVNRQLVAPEEPIDYKNALWRSKLSYLVNRTLPVEKGKRQEILGELSRLIGEYGQKVIPSIHMTLYLRRDNLLKTGQGRGDKSNTKGGE